MTKGCAIPCSLSCCANVCGEAIEVCTDAEAQTPNTLQQPVKETANSATNGTSSLFIILSSHLWVRNNSHQIFSPSPAL